MQAPNWFTFFFIYLTFAGCQNSAASLDVEQGDTSQPLPRTDILEAIFNYLLQFYPSSEAESSSMRWSDQMVDSEDFLQGAPKRMFFSPRPGKRSSSLYDEEANAEPSKEGDSKATDEGTRWKRSTSETQEKEDEKRRFEREAAHSTDDEEDTATAWWWPQAAVRRSPFSPRLGKRGDVQYAVLYDDDYANADDAEDDDSDSDLEETTVTSDYMEESLSPQRLSLRSALVPRLGKRQRDFNFSPRLGKRVNTFIPRLGKRGDFAFSPRLGKRGDFSFTPRLGKRQDFAFSPRLGKRGTEFAFSPRLGKRGTEFAFSPRLGKRGTEFAFSPRLGKRGTEFAFSPRLGKRGTEFAFSPRLGKKANFPFTPRAGKRVNAFSPRLGKRDSTVSSSSASSYPEDTWRPTASQVQQRSVAFSPRLG